MQLPTLNQVESYVDLTLNDSQKPNHLPKAYCSSFKCFEPKNSHNALDYKHGTHKKKASKYAIDCPDCGHALFWFTGNRFFCEDSKSPRNRLRNNQDNSKKSE